MFTTSPRVCSSTRPRTRACLSSLPGPHGNPHVRADQIVWMLSRKKTAVERLHRRLRIFRWLRLYSTVSADTAANGERWRRRAVARGSNVARRQCATLRCIKRCFGAEFHGRSHIETLPTQGFRSERTAGCSPVIPENTRYVCTTTTRWDKNVGTSSCKVGRIKRE